MTDVLISVVVMVVLYVALAATLADALDQLARLVRPRPAPARCYVARRRR